MKSVLYNLKLVGTLYKSKGYINSDITNVICYPFCHSLPQQLLFWNNKSITRKVLFYHFFFVGSILHFVLSRKG